MKEKERERTGIKKIIKLFDGYKTPEFATEEGGFFVTMFSKNKTEKKLQMSSQLDDVEKKINDRIDKHGFVTRADVEMMLNVKQTKAYSILKKLCYAGKLTVVSEFFDYAQSSGVLVRGFKIIKSPYNLGL